MKNSLALSIIGVLALQQAQATVMNFQVSPFQTNYAQFERVVSSSTQGIISIDSLTEKPPVMQYQVDFSDLLKSTDSGVISYQWGGNTFANRQVIYGGVVQQGDQGLQFLCSYLALTEAECEFDGFSSALELNLRQTQYADGSVSNEVSAAIRYEASKTEAGQDIGQYSTSTYRRNFMFNDWSKQDWGVELPTAKELLNWLSTSAQGGSVTEQFVLSNVVCTDGDCSSESTLYNLMVPGTTKWQVNDVSAPATASIMLLGVGGLLFRRKNRQK